MLKSQTLIRAPVLSLRLESGHVVVNTQRGKIRYGDRALRILDLFSVPYTIEEAMAKLWVEADGRAQWMLLSDTVLSLYQAAALVSLDDTRQDLPLVEACGRASIHIAMLNDRRRTSAFLAAIANAVRPGDVVVDLGTGTGILALAAARAGARAVYAIEPSAIATAAEAMFKQNGFADRIHLIRGWSTEVTLPERANVLVSEMVGHDPFDEGIAEYTADAQERLLTTDARVIPERMRVWALPVSVPEDKLETLQFTSASVSRWAHDYGFNFSPLLGATPVRPLHLHMSTAEARNLPILGKPVMVADIDVTKRFTSAIDCRVDFVPTQAGRLNGILICFDLSLAPGVAMSTHPQAAEETNHWGNPVLLLAEPLDVKAGDTLTLSVDRHTGRARAVCRVGQLPR